ncbi:MAG: hypothetical protein ACPGVD_08740 [Flavobacteriales bacterium]
MKFKSKHQFFIFIGCLIWIVSFLGELSKLQPYSTYGIIISPLFLFLGIIYWLNYYKLKNDRYPNLIKAIRNVFFENSIKSTKYIWNHVVEFFIAFIIFFMALVLLMHLTFGKSDAVRTAKNYCINKKEILSKTGEIESFGILVRGSISSSNFSGKSELTFTIVGEKGNFKANAKLIKENDSWEVINIEVE